MKLNRHLARVHKKSGGASYRMHPDPSREVEREVNLAKMYHARKALWHFSRQKECEHSAQLKTTYIRFKSGDVAVSRPLLARNARHEVRLDSNLPTAATSARKKKEKNAAR